MLPLHMRRHLMSLQSRILRTPNRRSVAQIGFFAALGQGITFLFLPIVSRIFDPSAFGVFGIYAAVVGIGAIIATVRLEYAIPLARNDRDLGNLLKVMLMTTFVVTALTALTTIFFGNQLASTLSMPELRSVGFVATVGIAVFAMFQVSLFTALREKNYRRVAGARFIQGGSLGPAQSLVGAFSSTAGGLAVGQMLSHLIGTAFMIRGGSLLQYFASGRLSGIRVTLQQFARFPMFSMPAALVNAATLRVPAILIAAFFGPFEAGSFVFSQSVLSAPVMVLGRSIGQVYVAELGHVRRTSSTGATRLLWNLTVRLLVVGLAVGLGLWVFAPVIFTTFFGDDWELAGSVAAIMALVVAMEIVIIPITQTLEFLEKQTTQLAWDLGRLSFVVGVFFASTRQGWTFLQSITAYSLVLFIFYLVLLAIMLRAAKEHDRTATR